MDVPDTDGAEHKPNHAFLLASFLDFLGQLKLRPKISCEISLTIELTRWSLQGFPSHQTGAIPI